MNYMKCSRLPGDYKKRPVAFARILHASPGTGPVDVYANGELVSENLTYTETAGYFTVKPCTYLITVYKSAKQKSSKEKSPIYEDNLGDDNLLGEKSLLAEACIEISPNTSVTIAIICSEPCVGLLAIPDVAGVAGLAGVGRVTCIPNRSCVRFVHLSQNTPPVDVLLLDGTRLFRNVPFTAHTRYRGLEPGNRIFRLAPSGSIVPAVTSPEYTLENARAYTLYAVGLAGGEPPLSTILTPDNVF